MYKCVECGWKFKNTVAAERAADYGCPGCGGEDIEPDVNNDDGFECDPRPKYDALGRPLDDDTGEVADR